MTIWEKSRNKRIKSASMLR